MKSKKTQNINNNMQKKFRLRVMYSKNKSVCYLSHLEVARALEKTIRRSKLNFCVSNGYSPHMRISFGRALNVGVACENEIFDIYLSDYVNEKKAIQALQSAQCSELPIQKCWYVDNKAPAPSCEYVGADYEVKVAGCVNQEVDIDIPKTIKVIKKQKEKHINVSDFFDGQLSLSHNDKEQTTICFSLKVNNGASIRPELFVSNIKSEACDKPFRIISIKKINIFNFIEH